MTYMAQGCERAPHDASVAQDPDTKRGPRFLTSPSRPHASAYLGAVRIVLAAYDQRAEAV
jgi:hypothetical protein